MNDLITSFCKFILLIIFILSIFVLILYASCESREILYYKTITPYGIKYEEIATTNSEKCSIIYNSLADNTNYGCMTKCKYIFFIEYKVGKK